ncbi:MAG: chromosomal replication initiator protein DnaA, partial [Nitrospina sp.]|nr:chromosomal replication initiator protein DnaA [Nitrospina sp.]
MTTLDDNLWEKCRTKIRNEISEESYNTWFQPINFDSITETKLILSVPNTFYKDCLEQNYLDII